MSRTENHIGVAREICKGKKTLEGKVKRAIKKHGLDAKDVDADDFYIDNDKFFYIEKMNKLFKIIEDVEDEYGHCVIKRKGDTYEYILSYYNGGGSFSEVFENTLEQLYASESVS